MKRRDKRYREQRLMFAFGQIMLPLVGIVAVAILILGIKMFFLPPKSGDTSRPVVKQEEPISASVPKQNNVPSSPTAKEASKGKVVMAVPVGKAPTAEQSANPPKLNRLLRRQTSPRVRQHPLLRHLPPPWLRRRNGACKSAPLRKGHEQRA